jgi:deoxyribodipyrimidine photolyase-related protein
LNFAIWRQGTTGIAPLDNEIHKAIQFGYAHHIVRLMFFLNILILDGIRFMDVKQWFMEVCAIDAWDWVMVSNVGAMGFFSPSFMTRPYIASSAYWTRMSTYKKGEWSKSVDALYHNFVNRNRHILAKHAKFYLHKKKLS